VTARRAARALAMAAAALAPLLLRDHQVALLCEVGLRALVALGLVLLTGVAGVTSFGQAAFVGVGAYATAAWTLRGAAGPYAVEYDRYLRPRGNLRTIGPVTGA